MSLSRWSLFLACGLASSLCLAEVSIEGAPEVGVFVSQYTHFQPGERVLTRENQPIEPTRSIPATLGTKFGMRYRLVGKRTGDTPLTLLYLTPGVIGADGQRHDKFEVTQALVVEAPSDVMAFEFTEPYEMVKGEWRFLVFQGDRLLAEQHFDVR
ncbi:DUF3859 domain-containing protein [Pseudomonas sp. RIT-PI-AD]|uniref:DUF3859 domain-containing protein n=1 Tax=Pseudomonas sp. RIT-PI-AD TaxID=3035294 RepID=UPI0021D7E620|nr:DUF3859 domain-containing protein [Pseudomonas sp. RIT-PI-AD]